MKKITWLDINSSYSHSSAALPFIEAQQKKHSTKYQWETVKGTLKSNIPQIISDLIKQKPDIIAYTSWLFTCDYLHQILSRIKILLPNTIIIGGGPEYLGDNKEFLKQHQYVDYVVRGEGEESFYALLKHIYTTPELKCTVQGACYIAPNGEYIDNGISKVYDFTSLILPEESQFFDWEKPFVQLETTRGCFNSCKFCVSGNDKPLRSQPLNLVAQRVATIHQKGIKEVRILDRTFNSNTNRALEMLSIFCKYPDINFHLELHPALLSEKVKQAITQVPKNVLHVEAGVQSLDEQVLNASGRKGERDKALDGLKFLCALNNLETHADLIAGLPYYSLTQIYSDVNTLANINAGEIQLESLKLLPGTEMRLKSAELGIRYSPLSPYEVLETDWITTQELQEAMALSRILDIYYNHSVWQNYFKNLLQQEIEFAKTITLYFVEKEYHTQIFSRERQGIILYEFIEKYYHTYLNTLKIEWILTGLSFNKLPNIQINKITQEELPNLVVINGEQTKEMRLYSIELDDIMHVFGYDRSIKQDKPIFYAIFQIISKANV